MAAEDLANDTFLKVCDTYSKKQRTFSGFYHTGNFLFSKCFEEGNNEISYTLSLNYFKFLWIFPVFVAFKGIWKKKKPFKWL